MASDQLCLFVVTNQCPLCASVFADKVTAQHHVANSLAKGRCNTDMGFKEVTVCEPCSLVCPFHKVTGLDGLSICSFEATHLSQLQSHIAQHLGNDATNFDQFELVLKDRENTPRVAVNIQSKSKRARNDKTDIPPFSEITAGR